MSGGRPYNPARLRALAHHIGTRPLPAGRVGLVAILWRADFDVYVRLGQSITGATYVKQDVPGRPLERPSGLWAAVRNGWRWGAIEHRLLTGRLRAWDAAWVERQWRGRVPV